MAQLSSLGVSKGKHRKNSKKLAGDDVLLLVAADGIKTIGRADKVMIQNIFIKVQSKGEKAKQPGREQQWARRRAAVGTEESSSGQKERAQRAD